MIPIGQREVQHYVTSEVRLIVDYRGLLEITFLDIYALAVVGYMTMGAEQALALMNGLGCDRRSSPDDNYSHPCGTDRVAIQVEGGRRVVIRINGQYRTVGVEQMLAFLESQRDVFELNLPEVTTC
jgi:hypothetical protein